MDERQIAFIICSNDSSYYAECIKYIGELELPQGYDIDIICVNEAESMAAGYNAAMKSSNAKYKVYLHQDTFIMNRNFIYDILRVFESDKQIGMIGVIGCRELLTDANAYLKWNVGWVKAYDGKMTLDNILYQDDKSLSLEVEAIDGLIMATQYDVPWREDILDGWDFYDVSQSLEMKKNGYKVVVPYQNNAWCYHDCGVSNLEDYDKYRNIVIEEYSDKFSKDSIENIQVDFEQKKQLKKSIIHLIELGAYEQLEEISSEIRQAEGLYTEVYEIINLAEIYMLEKKSIQGIKSDFFSIEDWDVIRELYTQIRWTLLRIGNDRDDIRIQEIEQLVEEERISWDAIRVIASNMLDDISCIYKKFDKTSVDEPLVSVIMPVYNGQEFISETIESIIDQSYKNLEIYIADDASKDKSREIIEQYARTDTRIKPIFLEKNRNICESVNICVEKSKGKYIAVIGHDDLWEKDKIRRQIMFLENHPTIGCCFTQANIVDEKRCNVNEKWIGLYNRFCAYNMNREEWLRKLFFFGNFFCAPSACIRKSVVEDMIFYKYGLIQLQDYYLWFRILLKEDVYVLHEKLTLYRRFNEEGINLSSINDNTQRRDLHETQWICDDIIHRLSDQDFIKIFSKDMINKYAISEKEIICEKAFLLLKRGICFAEKWFMELLDDKECRQILEQKYGFSLQDFYKINMKPMYFD